MRGPSPWTPEERQVRVRNGGSSGILSNPRSIIVNNPTPALTSLSPGNTITGSGPLTLEIYGQGLVSGAITYPSDVPMGTTDFNSPHLRVTPQLPALVVTGIRRLVVKTPSPTGGVSSA